MGFKLLKIVDVVKIPPNKFDKPIEDAVYEELRNAYEGLISKKHGLIIAVVDVKPDPIGRIYIGDPNSYHKVEATLITFSPFIKEVVEGEVTDVQARGVVVNLGCLTGFIHVSQITDERAEYDPSRPALVSKKPNVIIEKSDVVRARIYSASVDRVKGIRVHLTIKQPYLGKIKTSG